MVAYIASKEAERLLNNAPLHPSRREDVSVREQKTTASNRKITCGSPAVDKELEKVCREIFKIDLIGSHAHRRW